MHDSTNSMGFPHLSRSGINLSADDAEPKVWSDADEVRVVFPAGPSTPFSCAWWIWVFCEWTKKLTFFNQIIWQHQGRTESMRMKVGHVNSLNLSFVFKHFMQIMQFYFCYDTSASSYVTLLHLIFIFFFVQIWITLKRYKHTHMDRWKSKSNVFRVKVVMLQTIKMCKKRGKNHITGLLYGKEESNEIVVIRLKSA